MRQQLSALGVAAIVTLVSMGPGIASAQDVPYANYLVGERALGLGGAFVGLADDPSATFHNPAGLALLPQVSVSTSFWLVAWQDHNLEGGWRTGEGVSDLGDDKITSPPLVVTAVARLGPRDRRGFKRHAIGAAVIKPLREDYRLFATLSDAVAAPGSLATLDVRHQDSARWYGASYAYGPTARRLSFGVTGFLALRSVHHEEFELHGQDGAPRPSPEGYGISRYSVFAASLRHLVLRFGSTYTPSRRWRFGVMVQPPGLTVLSRANNRESTFDVDANGDNVVAHVVHQGLIAHRPVPWEVRVGATWFPSSRALVTADIGVHGGAGDANDPVRLVDDPTMPRPRFLVMESYLGPSVRVALGAERMLGRHMPARVGLFGYRSGLPEVPERDDKVSPNDMHTIGGSLSVGAILDGGHEVSFGVAGIRSWGTGAALDQAAPGQPSYVARDASETQVLLFIAGGRRAAKRLAKRLAKQSEEWLFR